MPERLIGKQMRRWEIDKRLRQRFEQDETQCRMETPVITVSRQWGSGGTNIAKLVAKELDFKLYDREIIDRVAELAGAKPEQIEDHEGHKGVVSDLVMQLLEGKRPTAAGYLRALVRTVRQIGKQGNAVIIGRAANFVLPVGFFVRIIAPEEVRVARISELHKVDERTARQMIIKLDRRRYRFVRAHFGADWGDPLAYDLVLNTRHISIEHAAALIIKGFNDRLEGLEEVCEVVPSSSGMHRP